MWERLWSVEWELIGLKQRNLSMSSTYKVNRIPITFQPNYIAFQTFVSYLLKNIYYSFVASKYAVVYLNLIPKIYSIKYLLDELSDVNFKPWSTTINKSFIWGAVMTNPFVAIIAQILIAIMQFYSQQEACLFKATIIFNVVK